MNNYFRLSFRECCFVSNFRICFSFIFSTLSTGLNSMAAVILEDFYKSYFINPLSELNTQILMKTTVVLFGAVCIAMVFIMEKLGSILQISMSVGAVSNGASIGIFSMGALLPWTTGIVRAH